MLHLCDDVHVERVALDDWAGVQHHVAHFDATAALLGAHLLLLLIAETNRQCPRPHTTDTRDVSSRNQTGTTDISLFCAIAGRLRDNGEIRKKEKMEQLAAITKSIVRVCKLSRVEASETLAAFIARSVSETEARKVVLVCGGCEKNGFVKCC